MEKIERICPKCGAANPYDRQSCLRCGTSLTSLPAPARPNLPAHVEGAGAAALIVGAAALVARVGWQLLVRGILPQLARSMQQQPRRQTDVRIMPEDQPDYVIRGWRAWSVRHGEHRSNGSENFEWQIKRSRKS